MAFEDKVKTPVQNIDEKKTSLVETSNNNGVQQEKKIKQNLRFWSKWKKVKNGAKIKKKRLKRSIYFNGE